MARRFKRNQQMHALSELNVTNLLDLAFVLLIIFMIATPLMNKEQTVPVELPIESERDQSPQKKDTIFVVVTVKANGTYMLESDANRPVSSRELPARLRALASSADDIEKLVIRIRADASIPFQNIITLMDELKEAKFDRVSFDTQVGSASTRR
jgi:biopolymer transport protein ExbD